MCLLLPQIVFKYLILKGGKGLLLQTLAASPIPALTRGQAGCHSNITWTLSWSYCSNYWGYGCQGTSDGSPNTLNLLACSAQQPSGTAQFHAGEFISNLLFCVFLELTGRCPGKRAAGPAVCCVWWPSCRKGKTRWLQGVPEGR